MVDKGWGGADYKVFGSVVSGQRLLPDGRLFDVGEKTGQPSQIREGFIFTCLKARRQLLVDRVVVREGQRNLSKVVGTLQSSSCRACLLNSR